MSRDRKSKKSKGQASDKVVPMNPQDSSHAGGASAAPAQDEAPSPPQTIEEVGLMLAQEVIAKALEGAKDEEVMVKLLTTVIERECINQVLHQEVMAQTGANLVYAQRTQSMVTYMMRRNGRPVTLPPEKAGEKGKQAFNTWYEEWKLAWEHMEQQRAAAGGAGDNGKANSEERGPEGSGA